MTIVKYRKIFYSLSILLVLVCIVALSTWGLKLGIDFKGGSIMEVSYGVDKAAPGGTSAGGTLRPDVSVVDEALKSFELNHSIRTTGQDGYIIRMREITEAERVSVVSALKGASVKRFDSIGPLLGKEAVRKSVASILMVIICIVLFITYAFRQVSEPVSSWKYGVIAIVALIHDVIVPTGAFAIFGHYFGYEVDTLFVTALLVVLGFSIHDTIVVFDRVRENLKHSSAKHGHDFEKIVGKSISQTFVRSINTSLTTVLALLVLYFLGPSATHHFSLALLIGIIAGTYSSIFIGSTLLVTVEKWQSKS